MICRYCGKRINSVRFCGICGKQSPIILKWNNYEECSEIREISKYLKNASLPSLEKNKEDKKENLEEIRDIKKIPENIKVKTVIPELNNNIPKINSNKKNPKKTNNISKRKYLILSVFVGIVVVAVGTVAAISLGSHNNDSGKDRNDKSEVDSEDIEESTLLNLENSSDKESTETSESETESNNKSTETSYTETTETNEKARKNKTMTNIEGTYYSVPDIYKNMSNEEDKFKIFNKKNNLYLNKFVKLDKYKLTYHNGDDFDVNYSNNGDYITLYKTFSDIGQEESSSVEESNSIEESNSVDDKEYGDFISYFKFNEFVGNETYEDESSEDSNLYFFKLKDKNINVTLMCNKLSYNLKFDDRNGIEESTDKYEATTSETPTVKTTTKNESIWPLWGKSKKDKGTESQDTSEETTKKNESEETTEKTTEKFIFDIVDGKGNHIECDKDVDNNFTIHPYHGIKGDPKGEGEVLRDNYIGKFMISRLSINDKNWFLLRDYNDKSSVYVVQYIKYNDEKNNN